MRGLILVSQYVNFEIFSCWSLVVYSFNMIYPIGCFVKGLYLEGAGWNNELKCLEKSQPKILIQELPILKVIPIEAHRLKLQVKMSFNIRDHLDGPSYSTVWSS